ncbi:MAG: TerB family tellurite resistance protein [Candidatus Gracilibacteria bacterium]|nr:TerB family tellurite resistance protein [Candidatus Gracilibacteria bacterium]
MGLFDFFAGNTSQDKNQSYLKNLIAVAMADGELDDKEAQALMQVATRLGISEGKVRGIIAQHKTIQFVLPKDPKDRVRQLWDLLLIVLVDGRVEERELAILERFALKLHLRSAIASALVRRLQEWSVTDASIETFKADFLGFFSGGNVFEV